MGGEDEVSSLAKGASSFPLRQDGNAFGVDTMHLSLIDEVEDVAPERPTIEVEATAPETDPSPYLLGSICGLGPLL